MYVIGDSTVSTYRNSVYPQAGWGQVLQPYFDASQVNIDNRAIGGRSSRSFYQEGRWTPIVAELQKGDYVLIQFGHNDRDSSKPERYTSTTDYQTYLRNYVKEARAKGAIPVLVSPMIMNAYRNGVLRNVFAEAGNDYRGAMASVANELKVPFADLNLKSFELVKSVGQTYATRYFYLNLNAGEYSNFAEGSADNTHFQEMGAVEMARLVVEGLEDNKSSAEMSPLLGRLLPRYNLSINSTVANAGTVTKSNRYPAGTPITLKGLVDGNNKFTQWLSGTNQVITNNSLTTYVMPKGDVTINAVFNNVAPKPSSSSSSSSTSSSSSSSSSSGQSFPAAKVFLIGDSTVSYYNAGYYPQEGWGQEIGLFFDPAKITIDNRALGGRSSKSFYNNHWADVKKDIRRGDFVFIQFGINDRNSADPARYAPTTNGTFQDYMTRFAKETQALGATPVFVSTVPRNAWEGTSVYPAYHEHPIVTRELANSLKIPLIDLNAKSTALLERVGQDYSTRFFYLHFAAGDFPNVSGTKADNVHFQAHGAQEMARLVAEGVNDLKNTPVVAPLVAALKPTYTVTLSSPSANAGMITRSQAYPAGMKLVLRAQPTGNNKFTNWQDGNGKTLSTQRIFTVTTPAAASRYYAVFNGVNP